MADPIELLTAKVDELAKAVAEGFGRVDQRLDGIDTRLEGVDAHFGELRSYIDFGHQKLKTELKADIGRVERKLDQFIDTQLRG